MKSELVQMKKMCVGDEVVCTYSMAFLHNNIEVGRNLTVVEIDTNSSGDFAKLKDDGWYYYVKLGDLYLNFEYVNLV